MRPIQLAVASALLALTAGCRAPLEDFLGSYSGTSTMIITGAGQSNTSNSTDTNTVLEGLSSDLLINFPMSGATCSITADVDEDVATVRAGVPCTINGNGTLTMTFTSGSLSRQKRSASLTLQGSFNYSGPQGSTSGTFSITSALTKVSK
jgi:hypothetical protein